MGFFNEAFLPFMEGGVAASCACLFTNPLEVAKTRSQLEARLSTFESLRSLWRGGMREFQAGLAPAIAFQIVMNGVRLGGYERMKTFYSNLYDRAFGVPESVPHYVERATAHHIKNNSIINLAAGASCGAAAAFLGSPFFLVKVRLQTQSSVVQAGHQHAYSGALDGLRQVFRSGVDSYRLKLPSSPRASSLLFGGIPALFRGATVAMLRVSTGGAVQLASYDSAKEFARSLGVAEGAPMHLAASFCASMIVVTAMNPVDVLTSRLYNQPVIDSKGQLYNGIMDCARKTFQQGGIRAFYAGFWPHYLRLGPHTVVSCMTSTHRPLIGFWSIAVDFGFLGKASEYYESSRIVIFRLH